MNPNLNAHELYVKACEQVLIESEYESQESEQLFDYRESPQWGDDDSNHDLYDCETKK